MRQPGNYGGTLEGEGRDGHQQIGFGVNTDHLELQSGNHGHQRIRSGNLPSDTSDHRGLSQPLNTGPQRIDSGNIGPDEEIGENIPPIFGNIILQELHTLNTSPKKSLKPVDAGRRLDQSLSDTLFGIDDRVPATFSLPEFKVNCRGCFLHQSSFLIHFSVIVLQFIIWKTGFLHSMKYIFTS